MEHFYVASFSQARARREPASAGTQANNWFVGPLGGSSAFFLCFTVPVSRPMCATMGYGSAPSTFRGYSAIRPPPPQRQQCTARF